MRRNLLLVTVLPILLISCGNMQIPERITVESSPTVRFPLGGRENILAGQGFDISDEIDTAIADVPELTVLDDEDILTLEFSYDVQDINLNDMAGQTFDLGAIERDIPPVNYNVAAIEAPVINPITIVPYSGSVPATPVTTIPDFNVSDTVEVPFEVTDTSLKAIELQAGAQLVIDFDLPADWDTVTVTKNLTLYHYDENDVEVENFPSDNTGTVDDTHTFDLAGLALEPGDYLIMNYTLNISGLTSDKTNEPVTITSVMTLSNNVTVTIVTDALDMSTPLYQSLTDDMVQFLQAVTFDDPHVYIEIENGLPFDISLSMASETMDLATPYSHTYTAQSASYSEYVPLLSSSSGELVVGSVTDHNADGEPDIDFIVDVSIDAYDPVTEILTLDVPVTGGNFTFSGHIALCSGSADYTNNLEALEVVLNTVDYGNSIDNIDLSALSSLDDMLPVTPEFEGIEAGLNVDLSALDYVMNSNPSYDSTVSLYMSMSYWYDTDDDGVVDTQTPPIDLIGTTGSPNVPQDVDTSAEPIYFADGVFDLLVNRRGTDVSLTYEVQIDGATIDLTVDTSTLDLNISIGAFAKIPVQLVLSGGGGNNVDTDGDGVDDLAATEIVDENGNGIISDMMTEDIFGRSSATENEEFFRWITGAQIRLELDNQLLYMVDTAPADNVLSNPSIYFVIEEPAYNYEKVIDVSLGTLTLGLTPEDIDTMISNYPFIPQFRLYVPDGTYGLGTGDVTLLSNNTWIQVTSEISYPVIGGE